MSLLNSLTIRVTFSYEISALFYSNAMCDVDVMCCLSEAERIEEAVR